MSRSRRRHPFCGTIKNADSKKADKRAYNRRFRHATEQALKAGPMGESLPVLREHSDSWGVGKDGKLRFAPVKHPKLMRK